MTSPLPPRRRDTRSPEDVIRQQCTNLRQLDPGLMGGRFSPTKPPEPFLEDDEEGDDEDGDLDLVRFLNTDRVILAADGATPVIPLTYIPDDGSEQVFWAGDALARHEWSRTDSALTIPAQSYYKANEEFWVDYAYYGEPSALLSDPVFVGGTAVTSGGPIIGNLALPEGTQAGNLIVAAVRANAAPPAVNSDPRMSALLNVPGIAIYAGVEDGSGDPVAITSTGSGGASMAMAVYKGASAATIVETAETGGSSLAVPTHSAASIVLVAMAQASVVGEGIASVPAGYELAAYPGALGVSTGRDTVGIWHWFTGGTPALSPAGSVAFLTDADQGGEVYLLEIT